MYDGIDVTGSFSLAGRKNYVREALDEALAKHGLPLAERQIYANDLVAKLDHHSFPLPPMFYDFDRAARIHARMEGVDIGTAQKNILTNPAALLEVHDVQNAETKGLLEKPKEARRKPGDPPLATLTRKRKSLRAEMPDDETIIQCAMNVITKIGKLPTAANTTGDKGHIGGLPEDGPKWSSIIMRLREERGTTLGVMIRTHQMGYRAEAKATPPAP
jgi:hypothetical protein